MPRRLTDEDATEDHAAFSATAKRLGLTGDDAARYVHRHMTGIGYQAEPRYIPGDDDGDDDDGGGFFGGRRRSGNSGGSGSRNSGRSGGRRRSRDDDDDYF